MNPLRRIFLAWYLALAAPVAASAAGVTLRRISLRAAADVVHATRTPDGAIHALLVRDGRVLHAARAEDDAALEVTGELLPDAPRPFPVHGFRPRIRSGPGGELYALWPARGGTVAMARSDDGGRAWTRLHPLPPSPARKIDVPAFDVAPDGDLVVMWVDLEASPAEGDAFAMPLVLTRSSDRGASFSPPREIPGILRACPCCRPDLVHARGALWIAYRTSVENMKEIALLRSEDDGRTFTSRQISHDRWRFEGCPGAGPSLVVGPREVGLAWTRDSVLQVSMSRDGGSRFGLPLRLGATEGHAALQREGGPGLLAWWSERGLALWELGGRRPRYEPSRRPAALVGGSRAEVLLVESEG